MPNRPEPMPNRPEPGPSIPTATAGVSRIPAWSRGGRRTPRPAGLGQPPRRFPSSLKGPGPGRVRLCECQPTKPLRARGLRPLLGRPGAVGKPLVPVPGPLSAAQEAGFGASARREGQQLRGRCGGFDAASTPSWRGPKSPPLGPGRGGGTGITCPSPQQRVGRGQGLKPAPGATR